MSEFPKKHWERTFEIDGEDEMVIIYHYTPESLALISSERFGKGFKSHWKKFGRYNNRLTIAGEKMRGWIFPVKKMTDLTAVLKGINKGEFKMEKEQVATLDEINIDDEPFDITTFNHFVEIKDSMTEESRERTISETEQQKTIMYFNLDETATPEGDLIYEFTCSRGVIKVYQLRF